MMIIIIIIIICRLVCPVCFFSARSKYVLWNCISLLAFNIFAISTRSKNMNVFFCCGSGTVFRLIFFRSAKLSVCAALPL